MMVSSTASNGDSNPLQTFLHWHCDDVCRDHTLGTLHENRLLNTESSPLCKSYMNLRFHVKLRNCSGYSSLLTLFVLRQTCYSGKQLLL